MASSLFSRENISNNPGMSLRPSVAFLDSDRYLVWADNTPGNYDIFFRKLGPGSITINLSENPGNSFDSMVYAIQNIVYIVWTDLITGISDVYFKRSIDRERSFENTINLSQLLTGKSSGPSGTSALAIFGPWVYVVWVEHRPPQGGNLETPGEIYFAKSNLNGQVWDDAIKLSDSESHSKTPQIALSTEFPWQGHVYVAWAGYKDGRAEVYFKKSDDYGERFGNTFDISQNPEECWNPRMVSTNNDVNIVWINGPARESDIFFRKSADQGNNFGDIINLSNNQAHSVNPKLAVLQDTVYIVWEDGSFSPSESSDIVLRKSIAGIDDFGNIINLSNSIGSSQKSGIATTKAATEIIVYWVEYDLANRADVFFRKSSISSADFKIARRATITGSAFKTVMHIFGGTSNRPGLTYSIVWVDTRQGANWEVWTTGGNVDQTDEQIR
jgi:hypothetical protein